MTDLHYIIKLIGGQEVELRYEGYMLRHMDIRGEWTDQQIEWFVNHMHIRTSKQHLDHLAKQMKGTLLPVLPDLSFDHFWNRYAHKVGNKKRAQKLWEKLPEAEKKKALAGVTKYHAWLRQHPNTEQCYAETYINQERWNNEY